MDARHTAQEETLKYVTPLRFRACKHSACPYVYLVCAVACALGFSTVENIGYTFQVCPFGWQETGTRYSSVSPPQPFTQSPTQKPRSGPNKS